MSVSYLDEYIAGRCMHLSVMGMSQGNLIICASQTFTKLTTRSSDDEKRSVVEKSISCTDKPLTDLARGRNKIYVQNGILACVSHRLSNNVGKRRDNRDGDILDLPSLAIVAGDRVRVCGVIRLVDRAAKVLIGS
jgi:hypothetical protein